MLRNGPVTFQNLQQLLPNESTKNLAVGLSILIKHDLVDCIFRTNDKVDGQKEGSFALDLTWTYVYVFKKHQCILRLSMSRWLGSLFPNKENLRRELLKLIMIKLFANGSLSKHEIAELLVSEYNIERSKIEGAIDELITSHFIRGAQDNKEQFNAAYRTVTQEDNSSE
jgi:hypothetical protein